MRDLVILLVHLITTIFSVGQARRFTRGRRRIVLAKHQLLILNRSRKRSPNLGIRDRFIAAFCSLWIQPKRLSKVAIAFKPSTLLRFHRALVQRKYRMLFSPKLRSKPGPKGPTKELTSAVVEMKRRNPSWGCPRIADQINLAFQIGRASC